MCDVMILLLTYRLGAAILTGTYLRSLANDSWSAVHRSQARPPSYGA